MQSAQAMADGIARRRPHDLWREVDEHVTAVVPSSARRA